MEIRQNVTRVPKQPTMLLVAVLFVLALGLVGWRVFALAGAQHTTTDLSSATTNSQGPDAQERNAQLRLDRIKQDATHGH